MFTIATWNVNSLKVRLPQVLDWLNQYKPDVLALQETKLTDDHFPVEEITAAGYNVVYSGQKTYNGVALLTLQKPKDIIKDLSGLKDEQRRVLGATIGKYRVLNLYVPNGATVDSDKYVWKLKWLKKLIQHVEIEMEQHENIVIVGDFNIAPNDEDVYDPKKWSDSVLTTKAVREIFQKILQLGFKDAFRLFEHDPSQVYSWWDYRTFGFKRNAGLRLDLILINDILAKHCVRCDIDRAQRAVERPSDHAPVIAAFIQR